ncbi:MAG: choice-of-anchor Q domain-containing protein [Rhodanobacteraceae bacterium]
MARSLIQSLRKQSLPACVAALLAAHAAAATHSPTSGETITGLRTVLNCDDAGPGSLRDAVFNAAPHDTIDLTQLQCGTITLLSGQIPVTVDDVKVVGPGTGPGSTQHLTIRGGASYGYRQRIFESGAGKFTVTGLELTDAHALPAGVLAKGGCINSGGELIIDDSIITECEIEAPYGSNAPAFGGGVFAADKLSITHSTISNNVAYSASLNDAYGGGIAASGFVSIQNSTIASNEAMAPGAAGVGGGMMVVGWGDVAVFASTISGNEADVAGGIRIDSLGGAELTNSTLSGNYAWYVGGASFSAGSVTLTNSTVTRNSAYSGLSAVGIYSQTAVSAESTILADNIDLVSEATLDLAAPSFDGASNLVTWSYSAVPPDTITACPRLSALGDHGGSTATHALIAGSPGINRGSNTIPLDTDQRGQMPFTRVFGVRADIGAYEWHDEPGDDIFRSAFEIRCDRYD